MKFARLRRRISRALDITVPRVVQDAATTRPPRAECPSNLVRGPFSSNKFSRQHYTRSDLLGECEGPRSRCRRFLFFGISKTYSGLRCPERPALAVIDSFCGLVSREYRLIFSLSQRFVWEWISVETSGEFCSYAKRGSFSVYGQEILHERKVWLV